MPRKFSFLYSLIGVVAGGAAVTAFTTSKHSLVRDVPFNSKASQVLEDKEIVVPILEPEQDDSLAR